MNKNLVLGLIIGLLLGLVAFVWQRSHFLAILRNNEPQIEEIYIRDTITLLKPIEIEKRVLVRDSILVMVRDTIRKNDTTYVALPRQEKTYRDTNYMARISGYDPILEEIDVYPSTKIVYQTKTEFKKKHFGLGLSLGYGATLNNNEVIMRPYLGVSLNYNLLSF